MHWTAYHYYYQNVLMADSNLEFFLYVIQALESSSWMSVCQLHLVVSLSCVPKLCHRNIYLIKKLEQTIDTFTLYYECNQNLCNTEFIILN